MQQYSIPEILRVPIHVNAELYWWRFIIFFVFQSLCLQAKLLSLENMTIVDYLSKAPEPPSEKLVRNAVQLLQVFQFYFELFKKLWFFNVDFWHFQTIDALDVNEDLTDLGLHICDLPLEPQLAKMLVVGVVLKCLDPVLTIVAALSYRDPCKRLNEIHEGWPKT